MCSLAPGAPGGHGRPLLGEPAASRRPRPLSSEPCARRTSTVSPAFSPNEALISRAQCSEPSWCARPHSRSFVLAARRARPNAAISTRAPQRMHRRGLYDAQPPQRYAGATALHVAAWKGHAALVAWLLTHGARADRLDAYSRTPLHVATRDCRALLIAPSTAPLAAPPRQVGATPAEMATIGVATITAEAARAWPHCECAVCFVAFTDKLGAKAALMPCGHVFCYGCVERWLRTHSSCPMCRAQLSRAQPGPCAAA
jgi:hypothetical protein